MHHSCEIIRLEETVSTNDYLAGHRPTLLKDITVAVTEFQTSGRGQRGNSWESERGKNLLLSFLITPKCVTASEQFILSEAVALSMQQVLSMILEAFGCREKVMVKWPNDIYVGDRKIAGILIENELMGKNIARCIIGVGLNVNQEVFLSDAPNPVSMRQLTGVDLNREELLQRLIYYFSLNYWAVEDDCWPWIQREYRKVLYRGKGWHLFRDEEGEFKARIVEVKPTGHLVLKDTKGRVRTYAFKEVQFVI